MRSYTCNKYACTQHRLGCQLPWLPYLCEAGAGYPHRRIHWDATNTVHRPYSWSQIKTTYMYVQNIASPPLPETFRKEFCDSRVKAKRCGKPNHIYKVEIQYHARCFRCRLAKDIYFFLDFTLTI